MTRTVADDDLFRDDPSRDEPADDTDDFEPRPSGGSDGVRIIGAEEAKSAYEEGDETAPQARPAPRRATPPSAIPPPAGGSPVPPSGEPERPKVGGQFFGEPPSASRGPAEDRPTGSVELPHWTEPPTGETPGVTRRGDDAGPPTGQVRFRDDERDWDESDMSDLAGEEDEPGVGRGPLVDDDEAFAAEVEARRRQVREARRAGAPPPAPVTRIPGAGPPPARAPRPPAGRPAAGPPRRPAEPREPGEVRMGEGSLEPGVAEPPVLSPSGGGERDLPTAILTGVAMGVAALLLFNWGRGPTAWLVAVIAALAAAEFYAAIRARGYRPAVPVGLAGSFGLVLASYDRGFEGFTLVMGLVMITALAWFLIKAEDARPVVNLGLTVLPVLYVGGFAAFGGLLLAFPNGIGMLLGVVIAGVAYDVIGYFVGSRIGTRRIAPSISPNKTQEGLIAGILGAMIVAFIVVRPITPWDGGSALWLGLVVGVAAPIGDLVESMLKRDIGVKDFGSLIPGHGGVLDRFDAILFSLPAAFYLVRVLELF